MNLSTYGTAGDPLRPSQLDKVVKCSVQVVLSMGEPDDEGGAAAQTGSLVHEAVAAFHREPVKESKLQAGAVAMHRARPRFPLADDKDSEIFFAHYAADPRNIYAEVVGVEVPVSLTIPPHPSDPTGEPIVIKGTLDQIRRMGSNLYVDDLKTGKKTGWEMVHDYAYQMSAYTLAARASGFPEARPGRVIRAQGYRTRGASLPSPEGVFWSLPWSVDDCWFMMERVASVVAQVRAGEVQFGPGPQCTYCPHGGIQGCLPLSKTRLGLVAAKGS